MRRPVHILLVACAVGLGGCHADTPDEVVAAKVDVYPWSGFAGSATAGYFCKDAAESRALAAFFPQLLGKEHSDAPATWKASAEIVFTTRDGSVLTVETNMQSWRGLNGTFPAGPGLEQFLRDRFATKKP